MIHTGDNLEILRTMEDESVDLIYLDPPFCSSSDYEGTLKDGTVVSFSDKWNDEREIPFNLSIQPHGVYNCGW